MKHKHNSHDSSMAEFIVDCSEDLSEDEEEESDIAIEVSTRTILHWNYRKLNSLPKELLSIFNSSFLILY